MGSRVWALKHPPSAPILQRGQWSIKRDPHIAKNHDMKSSMSKMTSRSIRPTLLSYRVRLMLPLLILTISAFAITSADPRPESNPQDPQDPNYYYTEYGEEYGDYYSNYKDNYEEVYNYEDGNEPGPSRGDQSLVSPPATPAPPPPTTTTEELLVRITSKNRPGYYWAIDEGTEGYLMQEAEMFRIKSPGLNGVPGSISFESVLRPGYYIVNKNGMIDVDSLSNSGFNEVVYNNECL